LQPEVEQTVHSYELIWIRRTCDWKFTIACCLVVG